MKDFFLIWNRLIVGILFTMFFFLQSCGQRTIPPEIVGQWRSDKNIITVRTRDKKTGYHFTSDSAIITFIINSDYTVEGSIGSAKFKNGKFKTNGLMPIKMTGISFTIECDSVGKIFDNDPLESKEVEIWLGPLEGNIFDAELRFTQGLAHFPMAGMIFTRID
jgi:hypothetical protein